MTVCSMTEFTDCCIHIDFIETTFDAQKINIYPKKNCKMRIPVSDFECLVSGREPEISDSE